MNNAFFQKDLFGNEIKPIKKNKAVRKNNSIKKEYTQEELCEKCQLYKICLSPKMNYTGEGKKQILVLGECAGSNEDRIGIQFVDEAGKTLRSILEEINIDLDKDCWKVNVVRCRTQNNRTPTTQEINYCKNNLLNTINELKPKKIITLGKIALQALICHKESVTSLEKWVSWNIPDQEYKCFICPNYHPQFLNYNKNDEVLRNIFKKNLYNAFYNNKKFKEYKAKVNVDDENLAVLHLNTLNKFKDEIIAIDIETTGLKPYKSGHKIYSIAITQSNLFTFSFLLTLKLKFYLINLLRNPNIKKIIQNSQFEFKWFKEILKTEVNNIVWDTQLASHVLDNKSGITGLKFQTYVNFGISDYSQDMKKYLEAKTKGGNEINNIKNAPVNKLLTYNAYDTYFTMLLYKKQKNQLDDHLIKGHNFFLEGNLELAKLSGIRFDKDVYEKNYNELTMKIDELHNKIINSREMNLLEDKDNFNYNSDKQLRELLFDKCKWKTNNITGTGKFSVDESTLKEFDRKFTNYILERRKLCKIRDTYLEQFIREAVEIDNQYFIFPFFSLNNVKTMRSCVAKGTLILTNRDFLKYPKGIPIEEIKEGDYVYCFDDNLKLQLKKVLWAGKTGHKKIIRIYYKGAVKNYGYLDVTPEHLVRNIKGKYIQAKDLLQDFRDENDSKMSPKSRVLSCHRVGDRLFATNQGEYNEHIFIYEKMNNIKLRKNECIHHKDGIHLNHELFNLQRMTKRKHSSLHYKDNLGTEASRKKNVEIVKKMHREGKYNYLKGKDNPLFLNLSKYDCLKELFLAKGKLTFCNYDFGTFKYHCKLNDINIKEVQLRFSKDGKYISKNKLLKNLNKYGFSECQNIFNVGYYNLKKLCDIYNISYERSFRNQFGYEKKQKINVNNHIIVDIKYIDKYVDVYDIEVEDYHNFIANEICVHNSSQLPNFQNIPARDQFAKVMTRSCLIPRRGRQLLEIDFKSMEVCVSVCYHLDPVMINYIKDNGDMHGDLAKQLYMKNKFTKWERYTAKNGFVFPSFYGSTCRIYSQDHKDRGYGEITINLWNMIKNETKEHLRLNGINSIFDFQKHVEEVENDFWNNRFKVYKQWKLDNWKFYKENGYVELKTGFRCISKMSYNDVNNYPIQGSAFHILLKTLIKVNQFLIKEKFNSVIIGQIHDSLVLDIDPAELNYVIKIIKQKIEEVRAEWKWIIVPLTIEASITEIDKSWEKKEEIKI